MSKRNFGGNVLLDPEEIERPSSVREVLRVLEKHRTRSIRAIGSLHSWSRVIEVDQVLVDLSRLDSVELARSHDGGLEARVGAGCTMRKLVHVLQQDADATLPAIGGVLEQTIAGAIATGTHGSGQHSISHHVRGLEIARFRDGRAVVETLSLDDVDPDEPDAERAMRALLAARCGLGAFGLVVGVRIACRRQYTVGERVKRWSRIEDVLEQLGAEPLQYFLWLPFDWRFVAFHRHPVIGPPSRRARVRAWLRRTAYFAFVDHGFHWLMSKAGHLLDRPARLRWLYRVAVGPLLLRNTPKLDRSDRALTLAHHLYRHVECEIAVPEHHIASAATLVRFVTQRFAGEPVEPPTAVAQALDRASLRDELEQQSGTFTLNYPMSFRRVKRDDTLLSQSSGGPVYTISFFSYAREIGPFEAYASFLTRALAAAFDARPHFGKLFYLSAEDVRRLYGDAAVDEFTAAARDADPEGRFTNDFIREILPH